MQTEGPYLVPLSLSTPPSPALLNGVSSLRAELCKSWSGNHLAELALGLHTNNFLLWFLDPGRGIPW